MISRPQMNRQLYADGTGIAELIGEQQAVAQDELTEEQIQAQLPIDLQATFRSLLDAGFSPEEAKIAIREQLKQISMASKDYSSYQPQLLEPGEEMGNVFISQPNPPGYAMGGITGLRQGYFIGGIAKSIGKGISGLVKGATNAVKDIVSSPIGKAALLYAGAAGLGSLAAGGGFGSLFKLGTYAPSMVGSNLLTGLTRGASALGLTKAGGSTPFLQKAAGFLSDGALGTGAAILGGAQLMSSLFGSPEKAKELYRRNPEVVRNYLRRYYTNVNPKATPEEIDEFVSKNTAEYATGGRVGYGIGGLITQLIRDNSDVFKKAIINSPSRQLQAMYMRNLNPQRDEEEILKYIRENAAYGGPMGELRTNQKGVKEIDYRKTGGFVPPIGIKEKADDIPAMLSNNEFVFTADAVRNAGGGDVNRGAQKMYTLMKNLENGGIA